MATFRPKQAKVCTLNFDDKFIYDLVLNESKAQEIAEIGKREIETLKALNPDEPRALDKAYNSTLDALDAILGEGAGADVMSLYENPGLFEVADVINFIGTTYREEYENMFAEMKKTGNIAPITEPPKNRGRK